MHWDQKSIISDEAVSKNRDRIEEYIGLDTVSDGSIFEKIESDSEEVLKGWIKKNFCNGGFSEGITCEKVDERMGIRVGKKSRR